MLSPFLTICRKEGAQLLFGRPLDRGWDPIPTKVWVIRRWSSFSSSLQDRFRLD